MLGCQVFYRLTSLVLVSEKLADCDLAVLGQTFMVFERRGILDFTTFVTFVHLTLGSHVFVCLIAPDGPMRLRIACEHLQIRAR